MNFSEDEPKDRCRAQADTGEDTVVVSSCVFTQKLFACQENTGTNHITYPLYLGNVT